jgi:hypothetical protein
MLKDDLFATKLSRGFCDMCFLYTLLQDFKQRADAVPPRKTYLAPKVQVPGGETPMPITTPAQLPRWVSPRHPTVIAQKKENGIAVSKFGQRGFTARSVKRKMRSHQGDPFRHTIHWV